MSILLKFSRDQILASDTFQKNQILGSENSKNQNLQKWTPLRSRSPQSKVMSILLKF